ncbi:class I adenylate-forming enzyme family protein [Variovorax rhizosphaerae]|uniref:Class I adenylate-forming enzyme family protein n=1 Tax=Variovorax rhizosphaerae TaxID=1836200 RepID=A0ABU8WGJ1_9BURK
MQRIHEAFDAWRLRDAGRPFLCLPEGELDFRALGERVDALTQELHDDGVRAGDRVLVVAENCPEHVALVLACSKVGAWSCGVNARMAPGEVAAFADKADVRRIYFTAQVSRAAAAHGARWDATASAVPGLLRSALRQEARAETGPLAERVAAIIFTSGTTGQPKGVTVTHDGLLHFGGVSARSRRLAADDRSYAYLPMTHIFGLATVLLASLHAGAGLVMRSQFDPADAFDALAHHRISQLQGPPTLFARLLAHCDDHGIERLEAPQLRYLYTGAGPLDMQLKQQVEARFGLPLHHGYGLSEYAGSVCVTALGAHRDDTSAGLRVEGAELRIVGADGQDLPAHERGEIWLRGRGLMAGYFRDDQATAQVMRPGGWYASGDLGHVDDDGALFVVGRLKEMIIRSGFNVYPGEVEVALQGFDAIRGAAVVGKPAGQGNEDVIAFVTLRPGHALDQNALDAWLRERLAPYKRPAQVHVVESFPMTHSGKVIKRELLAGVETQPSAA